MNNSKSIRAHYYRRKNPPGLDRNARPKNEPSEEISILLLSRLPIIAAINIAPCVLARKKSLSFSWLASPPFVFLASFIDCLAIPGGRHGGGSEKSSLFFSRYRLCNLGSRDSNAGPSRIISSLCQRLFSGDYYSGRGFMKTRKLRRARRRGELRLEFQVGKPGSIVRINHFSFFGSGRWVQLCGGSEVNI